MAGTAQLKSVTELTIIKASMSLADQDLPMNPPENPPEDLRTPGDRLADVSPLVWSVLGLFVVLVFIGLTLLVTRT